jgi:tetrahydromethanopterin S-methyltransferase subunit G
MSDHGWINLVTETEFIKVERRLADLERKVAIILKHGCVTLHEGDKVCEPWDPEPGPKIGGTG